MNTVLEEFHRQQGEEIESLYEQLGEAQTAHARMEADYAPLDKKYRDIKEELYKQGRELSKKELELHQYAKTILWLFLALLVFIGATICGIWVW
jgi:chromosome segregation ATPase